VSVTRAWTTSMLAVPIVSTLLASAVRADATQWDLKAVTAPAEIEFADHDCSAAQRTRTVVLRNDSDATIRLAPAASGFGLTVAPMIAPHASTVATVALVKDAPASGPVSLSVKFEERAVAQGIARLSEDKAAARERLGQSLALLQAQGPDFAPLRTMAAAAEATWDKRRGELERSALAARAEVAELIREKLQVLEEMAEGLYCSKCMRSRTEIEKSEHISFAAHLQDVQGDPVPAPPELMVKKTQEYDQKIASASARQQASLARVGTEQAKHQQRLDELASRRVDMEHKHEAAVFALEQRIAEQATIDRAQIEALNTRLRSVSNQLVVDVTDSCRPAGSPRVASRLGEQRAPTHDALGFKRTPDSDLLQAVLGSDLSQLNDAVQSYLIDHAGSVNKVLFEPQDMARSGLSGSESKSRKRVDQELKLLAPLKPTIMTAARQTGVPPALVAALAARESSFGAALTKQGYGDPQKDGYHAYGDMQLDLHTYGRKIPTEDGPHSAAIYRAGARHLKDSYDSVSRKHPEWTETERWRGAVAAYNFGIKSVRSKSGVDRGTTGNDYSGDVWARAQWLALSGEFEFNEEPKAPTILP
jgi:Transglycosylase SLT domain